MGFRFFVHPRKKSSPEAVLPGFPLNHVRARGQTDTSTHHKRDRVPPRKETKTLGAPWGRGCPMPPQKHGRSCRTSSTLLHHSPGGCSGDCELQLHFWNTTRRRRRHAPALRRARHPERGGGTFCLGFRRRRSAWGTHGLGGV